MDEVKHALLRIEGEEPNDNSVSVEVLVQLLEGMTDLSVLFGAMADNCPLNRRFSPPDEVRRRYRLRCGQTMKGGFEIPLSIVDETGPSLLDHVNILSQIVEFAKATSEGDDEKVRQIMPDSGYRDRAFRILRKLSPRRGERWGASLALGSQTEVSLNGRMTKNIERLLSQGISEDVMTVTGELIAIQFDQFRITIKYPPTNKQIHCTYLQDLEVDLFESRRDLIQLTGGFTLDNKGNPIRMTDVSRIEPVDLSPIELNRFEWNGRTLLADHSVEFHPKLDEETNQLYIIEDETLNLHVFASTRQALLEELSEQIVFIWDAYANEVPEKLTKSAQQLRLLYKKHFQEINCAVH